MHFVSPIKVNGEEMKKYDYQMRLILEHIFEKKEKPHKKNPSNWIRKMTKLIGGTLYQRMPIKLGHASWKGKEHFPLWQVTVLA
jgi:hypothetical protein